MSSLFVVFIPALLMLAAIGLERVEARLGQGCVRATEVAEFLAAAQPVDFTRLARDGMPEALDCFQRRQTGRPSPSREPATLKRALPRHVHAGPNPQFRPTRRADSV